MMPKTTLSAKYEEVSGIKGKKERISIMACSNATGTLKLPLVLIGKYAKPRATKNLSSLPVYYRNQKSAWMTSHLFKEWFEMEFVQKVTEFLHAKGLPHKAVLFMDNCSSHSLNLSKQNIIVYFFPPNATALIQPIDQLCCLHNLKMLYRQRLMTHIIDYVNQGKSLTQSLKDITIKEVIFWVAHAWSQVAETTIRKSWNQLLPSKDSEGMNHATRENNSWELSQATKNSQNNLLQQFHEAICQMDSYKQIEVDQINTWFNSPTAILEEDCLSNEEIINIVNGEDYIDQENMSDEDETPTATRPKISISETRNALKTVITYYEENTTSKEIIFNLHSIKEDLKDREIQRKQE